MQNEEIVRELERRVSGGVSVYGFSLRTRLYRCSIGKVLGAVDCTVATDGVQRKLTGSSDMCLEAV